MNTNGLDINGTKCWYILRHPKPTLIDDIFSRKVSVSLQADEVPLGAFEFFIPFCEINFRPSMMPKETDAYDDRHYNPMLDGEAFRSDLHSYVFVYGSEKLIDTILLRSWNRNLKFPLRALREKNGHYATLSREKMDSFRNAIQQRDFQISESRPVTEDVRKDDAVNVVDGPMKGSSGYVTEICERNGQVTLTVAFQMFGNIEVQVPGIQIDHVQLQDSRTSHLLRDSVLSNFENELIDLLCHRHGAHGSAEQNKADSRQLDFLLKYAEMKFESDEDSSKFTALMLICAYLKNDAALVERYTLQVRQLLEDTEQPSTDLQCYLMTALFIATHDVNLRHRVKHYRQTHPDCSLTIRRFQSIAKKIKL